MSIKPVEVIRDKVGYWDHPDVPDFDEGTTWEELKEWGISQGVRVSLATLEDDAPQEVRDCYFDSYTADCSYWHPEKPTADSFLLWICDTEEGPVSCWATPITEAA